MCPRLRVDPDSRCFSGGQSTPSSYGPNSLRSDRIVVKLGQNVRLFSANLPVRFQLDCSSIKEKVRMACVHGFESTRTRGAFREDNRLRPVMVLTPFVVIG